MRNAKLWSVLLAAVLVCACLVGVLFTGASASETRIPTATTTYVVGTDGDSIRACLEKAAGETWGKDDVLKIQFSGEDSSAFAKPDAANGISGYTLFETTTIFREDDTQLPIVIEGTDADKAALIKTAQNAYNATNDYYFTNLTINGGSGVKVTFYAGSGELVFENCKFNNYDKTYYYGDCQATDAFEGWDAAKVAANSNEDGLVETGITFGYGCTGLFVSGSTGQRFAAVGFNGDTTTNATIIALKRTADDVKAALTEDQVEAVREAAPNATFLEGNVVSIEDCLVKPWNTASHLIIDLGTNPGHDDTVPDIGMAGARNGVSPVRTAKLELISGGCQYIAAGASASSTNETYAGDTFLIMRGGRSGRQSNQTGSSYSDVGIRVTNAAMFVGDLTLEIHEDNPERPTWTSWIQTSQSGATSTVFGNYYFLMTGGTIGDGTHGNDGYWGAPIATGTIVNEVRGGKIWTFYGTRYTNNYENTPVSTSLPGSDETLTVNVTVHNKISGGEIGALVDGKASSTKAFNGQGKGSAKMASVCNEITGGTIYWFNAASSTVSTAPGDIYNFISGTETVYPTFRSHFHGTRSTGTTASVTNVIKGYPVFESVSGTKLNIYGGCAGGTVTSITNYLGGLPVFDDFYGGASGASDKAATVGAITTTVALDMTDKQISSYVWGGNGYYYTAADAAAGSKGNSSSKVTDSITCNVYSAHFGTFRAESSAGKIDTCPMTVNIYGGKWSSNFMPANRTFKRGANTSETPVVVTTNVYGGEFGAYAYMGGQNSNDREFVNNIYGGTFKSCYFGGGAYWAKKITNNIYGGTFQGIYYGGGAGYSTDSKSYYGTGSESITNNIYGGTFCSSQDYMGTYCNPSAENICEDQTIVNNFYGGDFGNNWVYGGHRDGTTGTIENNFYSGKDNPLRDPENELYKYFDAEGKTTTEAGTYFRDQVLCGSGYNQSYVFTNRAESITNNFMGGGFVTGKGGTNITIRCGMRWGIVGDITNNFIEGDYYRVFGGCDFGYVTGTITSTYGKELNEGEEAPELNFSGYVYGGGYDQTNGATTFSERIAEAKAAKEALAEGESLTAVQQAWINMAGEFGDDYAGGAKDIVNNVYYGDFHQFFGGSCGVATSDTQKAISHIDTITNNIYGGTFNKLKDDNYAYTGGCFRNAVIKTITNNIKGGTFLGNYYGGSIGIGAVDCDEIINVIDYAEGNKTSNTQFYLGNGAPTYNGTVTNTINDFKAYKTYVYGGSTNIHNQPEDAEYGIFNTINGGEFSGFWGLGAGTASNYTGNVKTVVNGGTFNGYDSGMPNALIGGPRNATLIGNIELEINGGTFNADVVGGTIWGSQTAACDTINGNVTTTINGGIFNDDIFALSRHDAEDLKCTGAVTLNVNQTAGEELKIGGKADITNFTANGEKIDITAKTNMVIANLTGELALNQTEGWLAHDYVVAPANAQINISEADTIYGGYCEDKETDPAVIRIYGGNIAPIGATIRLSDRLGVRVLFGTDDVNSYGDAFTYAVKLDGTTLISGGKADLEMYQGNYSIVFDGIGLGDFGTDFVLSGSCLNDQNFSIVGLATDGQSAWSENYPKWAEYAGAILEFHSVYNEKQANAMTPAAVETQPKAEMGEAGVADANITLLMGDAAGLRLTAKVNGTVANAKFTVNGEEVTATVSEETIPAAEEGGEATVVTTITADVYFAHDFLATEFVIAIESDAGVHMTYTATIEAIAAQLANDDANALKNNAIAFLYYIQKAVACK